MLKASGSRSTKKYPGKVNQHIFQEKKKSYTINFWPSKKTLIVQGNEKIAERINKKIDKILELMSKGSEEIESLIDEILEDRPWKIRRPSERARVTNRWKKQQQSGKLTNCGKLLRI